MPTESPAQLLRYVCGLAEARGAAELPDDELVREFADRRDERAFATLVQRHGPLVLGVCRRVLGREQDAEDVFQATFLVLSRKAGTLRHKRAVGPWLFGVARRLALRARQEGRRRREREARVAGRPGDDPLAELTVREAHTLLDEELARLPERDRGPVVLCYLQGLTRDEAAQRLGCPLGTLKSRLERARAALQKRLTRRGVALAAVLATHLLTGTAAVAVPADLVTRAGRAGVAFAGGATAGGMVGLKAVALAEGVLRTMLLTKLKIATAVLVAVAVLGAGTAALTQPALAEKPAVQPAQQQPAPAERPAAQPAAPAKEAAQPAKQAREDEPLPALVGGLAKAVDAEKNTLTVARREGDATFSLANDARITIDGQPGELARVPAGANVTLTQFIDPKTARSLDAEGATVFANVKAVDAGRSTITVTAAQPDDRTYHVTNDTAILIDGKPGLLAGIPAGAFVHGLSLCVDQRTARCINVEGPGLHHLFVKAVDAANHTITFDDKAPADVVGKTLAVAQDADVRIDGQGGKLAGVPPGAVVSVTLSVDRQTVRRIAADGPDVGGCGGTPVKAVDAANRTITFDDKGAADATGKTFTVAKDAHVTIDGRPGTLAVLPAGAYVSLTLSVDQTTARHVRAQGPSDLCDAGGSLVKAIDIAKHTITFDDKARAEVAGKTFAVAKDANILIDSRLGTLAELPTGSYVSLHLAVDRQTAHQVRAQGGSVRGVVKSADAAKNTITIDDDKTYPVAKDAHVLLDAQRSQLARVPAGATVSLELRVDEQTVSTIHAKTP